MFTVSMGMCVLWAGMFAILQSGESKNQPSIKVEPAVASIPTRHALLIGVTNYDHLPAYKLRGPGNDVATLRHVLTRFYGFALKNVVSLTEAEKDPNCRPTRANIERNFRRLADEAQNGDQIFILLSGHGDRQPETSPTGAEFRQADGINEIFLAADVRPAEGDPPRVPNSILDIEFRDWLSHITDKNASVWAVFDCCHAGDMSRGLDNARQLPPGVLVPIDAIKQARQAAVSANRSQQRPEKLRTFHPTGADRLVVLYACRPNELTLEWDFPAENGASETHGILSHTLAQVLTAAAHNRGSLTYRDVLRRIELKYAARSGWASIPTVEGTGRDRFLFEDKTPYIAKFQITTKDNSYRVNAGEFHGLTADSVLVVYEPGAATTPEIHGYARVVSTTPFESVIEPLAFDDRARPDGFPLLATCDVVRTAFKIPPLNVAVISTDDEKTAAAVRNHVRKVAEDYAPLIVLTDGVRGADWLVSCSAGKPTLVDATGNDPIALDAPDSPQFSTALGQKLLRIYRARSLIAVGERLEGARRNLSTSVDFDLKMFLSRPGENEQVVDPDGPPLLVFPKEHVRFEVRNKSAKERIDVALLIVGSDHRITSFYPGLAMRGKDIKPGEGIERESKPYTNTPPFGLEYLVAIAVPARNKVDFSALVQPGLTQLGPGDDSPLSQLLNTALNGMGTRGDLDRKVIAENAVRVISWRTVPTSKKSSP